MTKEEAEFRVRLKKKRNHDVIKSFACTIVGVLLIFSVIAYFATPISKSKKIYVKGNKYLTKENINSIMHNDGKDLLLTYGGSKASKNEKLLNSYPLIQNAKIVATPFSLKITIEEIEPLCYLNDKLYFTDGQSLDDKQIDDGIFTPIVNSTKDGLMEFYPDGLQAKDYKTFFAPFITADSEIKTYIDSFSSINGSPLAYRFFVKSTNFDFYYSFECRVDHVNKAITKARLQTAVDAAESSFQGLGQNKKDYNDYLQTISINGQDRSCVRVKYASNDGNDSFYFITNKEES